MAEVTVCIVTQDNRDLLRLTVESFRRHNTDVRPLIWVWCNNCTDGSIEWARDNVDRVFVKDGPLGHHHAEALDRMVREVATPYVLTLDNDVLTTAPFVSRLTRHARDTDAFSVGLPCPHNMGTVDHFGRTLRGQRRIDPCCALFQTDRLMRMTDRVSFTPAEVTNLGRFYDTGGMLRAAAEGAGLRVEEVDWLRDAVTHYGSLTWAMYAGADTATARDYSRRRKMVQTDIEAFDASFTYDLVVARHAENVDWTANQPARLFVYDKSDNRLSYAAPLDNVGREAHTFAEHVARHYDDLAEVTVFAQGNPFDHAPDFLSRAFAPTGGFRAIGSARLTTGPRGDPSHALPMTDVCKELTGRPFPDGVTFTPGAQFAAHRSALRRYPRTWWRRLADRLAAPDTQTVWPWALERLWRHLLTAPPRPHIYHQIVGWFSSHEMYRRMVDGAVDGAHFVEVGAYVGRSASFMATEILNSNKRIRFDVVDTFKGSDNPEEGHMKREIERLGGSLRPSFERNTCSVRDAITVVEAASVDAAATYADDSLDFVYVDASHDEDSVAADLRAWFPKVKPGGWIGGDDMTYYHPGVEAAVYKFFGYPTRVSNVEWLAQKPQRSD